MYETESNSSSWINGNDAISIDGSLYSATSSVNMRRETGTPWDNFAGDSRRLQARSNTSRPSNNPRFAKQNAIGKTTDQRAAEAMQREEDRKQYQEDQVYRDDSEDSENEDDGTDPY